MIVCPFNSIMVQLELFKNEWHKIAGRNFQFHYGSIRTQTEGQRNLNATFLSIPLWFN